MPATSPRPRLTGRAGAAEHQAAVARRLDLLRAELAAPPGSEAADDADEADDADDGASGAAAGEWWADATRLRPVPVPAARVAAEAPGNAAAAGPAAPAGRVPVPGRHASRRRVGVGDLVPEGLRGRFALGAPQLGVVAVVVAVGLAVTTWLVVRADPEPAAAAPVAVVDDAAQADPGLVGVPAEGTDLEAAAPVAATSSAPPAAASSTVTVDVAGKVRRPGIAVLGPGARVVDAIEAAGGARPGVDLTSLNLARPLVDGEQVLVGVQPPPGAAAAAVGSAGAAPAADGAATALVDLNAATEAELDTLPDVGPVTAQSILAWRSEHGGFTAVDELLEVDGIGEATLARIAPHVTV